MAFFLAVATELSLTYQIIFFKLSNYVHNLDICEPIERKSTSSINNDTNKNSDPLQIMK